MDEMKRYVEIPLKVNKRDRYKARFSSGRNHRSIWGQNDSKNDDFKCVHCGYHVTAFPGLSAVNHRNHCPYCLYSRHLDLHKAGDRLSACKEEMKPIGLVLKKTTKKYNQQGELMLLHQCRECGAISINRIAADDDIDTLISVYENSLEICVKTKTCLEDMGIHLLDARESKIIRAQLFGR
jgi:hypothetical protein